MPRTLVGRALLTFAFVATAAVLAALLARSLERPAQVGVVIGAASLAALAVPLLLARDLGRKLTDQRRWIESLEGDDTHAARPAATGPAEVDDVARAADALVVRQADRLRALAERHAKLSTVLDGMSEGVLAVDRQERVILLNPAAARFFGVDARASLGLPVEEVARNATLLRLVTATSTGGAPEETDAELAGEEERLLQVRSTPLRDAHGHAVGALLVLNDVTRVRRLENVRRDFVANVSHEIRTPLTTIKGFVETLLDGALRDPKDTESFLRIIARHADRLNAIVEDLLALSRLEQEGERARVALEDGRVADVLRAAVDACRWSADAKGVDVTLVCPPEISARINAPLLEQAVVNLVDNAIKYSEPGSPITVEGRRFDGNVVITVGDRGSGIEAAHLPRLFERFYRVDKARSRKVGGTGLGLAIVKHVAQAHGGSVSVESTPGRGSSFSITLPAVSTQSAKVLTEN